MKIYDATLFKDKPTLPANFIPLPNANEAFVTTNGNFDSTKMKAYAGKPGLFFFDIEGPQATPERLILCSQYSDKAGPGQFGFYGIPSFPWIKQWDAATFPHGEWRSFMDKYKAIADYVDVAMPTCYTSMPTLISWQKLFLETIRKTREMFPGKPVYPFLWPVWHDGSEKVGNYIGDEYWQFQLNQCRRHCDGAIIWGGWDTVGSLGKLPWDDSASWWKIAQQYL